ncbi:HD domain-containing phosphohydrolase [Geobacter argillaceus]|uniref:Putative nucleotidyltransferase with HDIG domain n=1 Tax=Geobacter argillaceus TaxID=345631 RepID=A0A562WST5_9BACT|nr:HD domain-containing phosphohydrolase [Geobacter argillaceus]TWJ32827.1 putative nucleotidyltransferase with HDIG domain [Geobacter argillaceus]
MKKNVSYVRSLFAQRMFALFILCALVPVCILTFISLGQISGKVRDENFERLRHAAKNVDSTIHEGLLLIDAEINSALVPREYSSEELHKLTQEKTHQKFLGLTLFRGETSHKSIFGAPIPPPHLDTTGKKQLEAGTPFLYLQNNAKQTPRIFIVTSKSQKQPGQNMLVGEINPEYLWQLVEDAIPPAVNICILDPNGTPLFSTTNIASGLINSVLGKLSRSQIGHFEWNDGAEEHLISYRSVFLKSNFGADGWTVVVAQSKKDAFKPVKAFLKTFYLVVFLTLLIVVFISSIQIRRSLIPLSILREGAQKISDGDLTTQVTISSGDEFEDLASSFNAMSIKLGRNFNSLDRMGKIVRSMLGSNCQESIVKAVMPELREIILCDSMGLSLMDTEIIDIAVTIYDSPTSPFSSASKRHVTVFTSNDLEILQTAAESILVHEHDNFSSLLAPLTTEGATKFLLLPIFIKNRVAGVLTLGYRQLPVDTHEVLIQSRQVADQIAVALENIFLIEDLDRLNLGAMKALANTVDAKSPWTAGHSERVTRLAVAIGREMELTEPELDLIHKAGLFHDIGKIGIPEAVLDKAGKLTDDEYALIKKHPEKGREILMPIEAYHDLIPLIVQHHERFDGHGYPTGLSGDEISLGARIMAVSDVYDALISDRPYRPGWELPRVLEYMGEEAGKQFDPVVVQAFFRIINQDTATRLSASYLDDSEISVAGR